VPPCRTSHAVPGAAGASSGAFKFASFNAVACLSATTCLAVADDAIATVQVSTGATEVTARPTPPKNGIDALSSIACAGTTSCYAVGFAGSEVSSTGLILHLSPAGAVLGRTKTAVRSDGPIACPTSTLCLVGADSSSATWIQLLRSGHLGTKHARPAHTYVEAVSCFSAKACFALVGDSSSGVTNELFPLNPKTGSIGRPARFKGFSGRGLICTSASRCLVVGNTGSGSTFRPAVVVVTSGKPAHAVNYPGTGLNAIACATSKLCYAVGLATSEAIVDRI